MNRHAWGRLNGFKRDPLTDSKGSVCSRTDTRCGCRCPASCPSHGRVAVVRVGWRLHGTTLALTRSDCQPRYRDNARAKPERLRTRLARTRMPLRSSERALSQLGRG